MPETAIREHPMIFSGDSVRAINAGTKTQTRRIIKPQPVMDGFPKAKILVGHRIWVKETWQTYSDGGSCWYRAGVPVYEGSRKVAWDTDYTHKLTLSLMHGLPKNVRWRSSLFMPRWASRITLEITSVRAERLQQITHEDALAEGIRNVPKVDSGMWFTSDGLDRFYAPETAFAERWDALNGDKPGCAWKDNPWVWVIEFRKVTT